MGDTVTRQCSPSREHSLHAHVGEEPQHHSSPATLDYRGDRDSEKNVVTFTSDDDSDDIYDRFSVRQKRVIVAVVSSAALLAPFASASFFPSVPQVSADMGVSQSVINYTISVYLVVIGLAPLGWSPYSTFYGRQRIYLLSIPVFVVGSIGVAECRSLLALILTRAVQGIGASSVLAVGAGSIGDIYKPTERGRAMGVYYGGAVLGPALAPVIAGIMTEYAHSSRGSWRGFQYLLAAMGTCIFTLMLFFLPETSHSRGVDQLRASLGNEAQKKRWIWVWLNPLRPLKLLKYRNVLAITMTSSLVVLTAYSLLIPLTYTLGPRYGISNTAILGTLYLAPGLGNIVGSRVTGYLSDSTVARWIDKRSGQFVPEDRLRSSLVAAGLVVPLSLLGVGLTMQFWTSTGGLAMSLVLLFFSGIGLLGVVAVCNTYLVDVMQDRSAEVISANNCVRYVASAGASAVVLPLMQSIGIAATNAISMVIALLGFALICVTIRYGKSWREAWDVVAVPHQVASTTAMTTTTTTTTATAETSEVKQGGDVEKRG